MPHSTSLLHRLVSDPWKPSTPSKLPKLEPQPDENHPQLAAPLPDSQPRKRQATHNERRPYPVSLQSFFGPSSTPRAPSLGKRAKDAAPWSRTFFKQKDAFAAADADSRCSTFSTLFFSFEQPGEQHGRRSFAYTWAGSDGLFAFLCRCEPCERHVYELLRECQPVKLFFDVEFSLEDNPELDAHDGDAIVDRIIQLTRLILKEDHNIELTSSAGGSVVELKNYSEYKFSAHVIINLPFRIGFENTCAAGDLAAAVTERAQQANLPSDAEPRTQKLELLVAQKGTDWEPIIDLSVYSRNRTWRLPYCSKASKPQCRLSPSRRTLDAFAEPHDAWWNINVGSVLSASALGKQQRKAPACDGGSAPSDPEVMDEAVFKCSLVASPEADESKLIGRRSHRNGIVSDAQGAPRRNSSATNATGGGDGCGPFIETSVLVRHFAASQRGCQPNQLRVKSYLVHASNDEQRRLVINLAGTRYCERIEREHASNNVFFLINFDKRQLVQKCHDPACAGFVSHAVPLPLAVQEEGDQFIVRNGECGEESNELFLSEIDDIEQKRTGRV